MIYDDNRSRDQGDVTEMLDSMFWVKKKSPVFLPIVGFKASQFRNILWISASDLLGSAIFKTVLLSFYFIEWLNYNHDVFAASKASLGLFGLEICLSPDRQKQQNWLNLAA